MTFCKMDEINDFRMGLNRSTGRLNGYTECLNGLLTFGNKMRSRLNGLLNFANGLSSCSNRLVNFANGLPSHSNGL